MKNILYLVILMISQIETRQISKYCVCRHAESMDNCQKSQICIWKDGRCDLRQGETYIKQDLQNQENQCNRYAQEDCIEMEMCGFYLGECIRFTECSLFQKNQCQESSLKCVSDGQKCIEKKECTDYETEIGCQNRNKNGNYCFWDINQQPKCQNVSKCIQLPKYLKSDLDCRNEYLNCTVNEEGFGCEEERQKCEEYTVENQCYFTQNKNIECFWDVELQKCFEKNCENKRLTTYDECNSYMEKCSTNGIHCIEKKECIDIKNGIGCVQDKNNNKCVYQNGNCQIKSCKTAPLQYNNYEQCQQYDQKLDCVSAQNGGCKNRPTQCIDYQSEIECYSWKIQDCIWYENKCAKRQCFHAPKSYNNSDCRLLGKCMGTINGGCQLRPETCQEILTQEFCEITYDESLCIWEQNQCKQLICSNLKLPKYDSHQKCQEASKYCTFSIETGGCLDYLCSKVVDITACTIDSQGQLCQINDGCILKICKRAPSYYNTNQQCESWISKCTVKIYQFDGFNLSFGCIDKPNECSIATQEQCYSTFSGNKCKWESQSKKCVSQQCIDADNSHTINDKCINYKVENQSCFINNTNNGCIDWPSSCSEMVTQIQCQIGLKNNQAQCVWSIDKCRSINCSDAQNTLYTNNIQCSKYQKDCIVNSTLEGCITRPTNLICSSSPKNDMYDTHQECQAWNPNCTIPDPLANLGCQLKSNSCSDYTSEAQCKIIYDPQYPYVNSKSYCFWDYFTSTCQSGFQDPDYQCNRRIIGELTHTDCENFMKICTINKITATCIPLQNECTNYTIQQSCVINHYQQPCYWDRFQSKCLNLSCYENTTALTELTCSQYKRQNLCQLIHNEQGIPQMGCEDRPSNCSQISHQQICNKTITTLNQKCYYYNKKCNTLTNEDQCQFINFATTDQECQYYHQFCLLQQSGVGCYSANKCSSLVRTNCQSSYLQFNNKCLYYNNTCRSNLFCADLFTTSSSCDNVKTSLNILCSFEYIDNSLKCVPKQCVLNNLSGSLIEKQTQCQNFSSICTYDMSSDSTLRSCKEILNCSDLDVQGSINYKLCNQSLTASFQKCGFNFDSNICQDRQCEHLKFTNYGPLSDEQCYNWNYNCVFDGINCKTFDNIDCTQIKLKYQCLQYSQCKLQQNDCVKNINCELNTTSTSIYECQLIHSICSLNYIVGHGCKLSKCENISNPTYCDFTRTGDGMECYWNTSSCIPKSCNLFLTSSSCESSYGVLIIDTQITTVKCYWCNSCSYNNICNKPINQVTHEDCQKENIFTTISFTDTTKCILKKNNCEDYTFKESCVTTINDVKCAWTGSCKDFCQSIATVPTSNQNCYTFDKHCMIGTGTCVQLDCSKLTAVDCVIYEKICTINSLNVCIKITDCSSFSTTSACNLGQDQYGYNCIDNGGTCQRVSVTEDCSSLGSLDNHEQCEQFFRSGKCTVKSKNLNCIDLPNQCGNNISEQLCLIDKDSKRCYWNNVMNSCIQLVNCSDLGTENDSHEKCNSYMQDCTVNQLKNGCIEIDECFMYSIKEQCRIEKGNKECEWVSQQNLCKKKSCETAQLKKYTAGGCQMYYDQKCTVNSDFTQCEQAQGQCQGYQEQQCKSEGQLNLEGTECFWNKEQNQCVEKTCENGPKFALSDLECQGYMQSCQKGGCRLRICSDYFYAVDSACSEIFPNKKCATNGYQCVDRGTCEDALIRDGCTFDINLNDCVWIQKKCILKTCNTAEKSLSTHKECQDYLQKCTSKKDGGCIQIDECYLMQIEEGCKSDKYNQGCVWDDYLGLCLTDICEGYCGDGIITNHLEICDDGNFVPYDGCYKCQIQCSLGCLECEGKICKICDSYGWRLLNTQCQSICGDGIIVGKEYCDDGNQVEFDGCYNCEYSCDPYCQKCFQGTCIECPYGLYQNESYCINKCGDGIYASQYEQCEDGNTDDNDGCNSDCIIEKFWKCYLVDSLSVCIYNISPQIKLNTAPNSYGQNQEVILSFTQDVRLNSTSITEEIFLQLIQISISNLEDSDYTYEIVPILSIDYTLQSVGYRIKLKFQKSIVAPILTIKINCNQLVNQYDNQLISNQQTIQLKDPFTLSSTQKLVAASAALFNEVVIYSLISLASLAFLCGNLEIFWNLLDTLQQLSYFKYLNLQFPENVAIYFEVFSLVTIQPIMDKINFSSYSESLLQFNTPFIPAYGKFQLFSLNSFFVINLQSFLFLFIVAIANYILAYLAQLLLTSLKYDNLPMIVDQRFIEYTTKIIKAIYFVQKKCKSYYQYFFYSGILRIYLSNYYDLTFSALLQIVNLQSYDSITLTSSVLAIAILLFNFTIIFQIYSYLLIKKTLTKRFSIFFEGLQTKQSSWNKQYITIILIKKTVFIANLILNQAFSPIQPIITSIISCCYTVYVYKMRPFEDQFENYKIIITESIIAINTILFSISESLILFSKIDFLAIFGWIEIVGFSFILLSSLILDFYQQLGKPTRQIYQILQKCVSKTTLDNSNSANPIIKETVVKFF